jgi:UDP-glucuronate 4-epimerase
MYFIRLLEKSIGKKAKLNFEKMQPGDLKSTWADTSELSRWIDFKPKVKIEEGVTLFSEWFLNYKQGK